MIHELTLLQRSIVHQLREAGLAELARQARDCWSRGERSPFSYNSGDRDRVEAVPDTLRPIFDRANAHAERSSREIEF